MSYCFLVGEWESLSTGREINSRTREEWYQRRTCPCWTGEDGFGHRENGSVYMYSIIKQTVFMETNFCG